MNEPTTLADFFATHTAPHFNLCSMRPGSVPSPGSACVPISRFSPEKTAAIPVTRIIKHRTHHVTAVTPIGYFKLWHEPTA